MDSSTSPTCSRPSASPPSSTASTAGGSEGPPRSRTPQRSPVVRVKVIVTWSLALAEFVVWLWTPPVERIPFFPAFTLTTALVAPTGFALGPSASSCKKGQLAPLEQVPAAKCRHATAFALACFVWTAPVPADPPLRLLPVLDPCPPPLQPVLCATTAAFSAASTAAMAAATSAASTSAAVRSASSCWMSASETGLNSGSNPQRVCVRAVSS
mmetsp:Transcript_9563/g.27732  ORF Transcript_9563/g.27732 Transcript_9563/m.27732 type:complete len:212 (+) Transcript_9563:690-1325(+)